VELKVREGLVAIHARHRDDAEWQCPDCAKAAPPLDHVKQRVWRHLDSCQLKTFMHAWIPSVRFERHGVRQVKVPWALPGSRFTALMERMIIDVIHQCSTLGGACAVMRVSWDEASGVMNRAVQRGLSRRQADVVRHIGVDEKAFCKGHSYMTIVSDLENATVQYVGVNRTAESLAGYYAGLTAEQRGGIEAVAMDMWEPFVKATRQGLPLSQEKIVFDCFHIIKQINGAVDKVRLAEHREMSSWGCGLLKGTKHMWLYGKENLPEKYRRDFAVVKDANLRTARAWAIKETLRELWSQKNKPAAGKFFGDWFGWAKRSQLTPVKKVADMIKSSLASVLNYFGHRITNDVAEGLNSRIMTIKRKCCGFRSTENFKTAIYLHCGGLNLYPQ